jgi:hypothetical protein
MDNLLSYRFEDSVVIIRGFLNLDRFPYQEEISRAINGLPTEAPETILKEQDRKDIPTSPTLLPAMYNKINNQIRSPIQWAIDRFNEHHEEQHPERRVQPITVKRSHRLGDSRYSTTITIHSDIDLT